MAHAEQSSTTAATADGEAEQANVDGDVDGTALVPVVEDAGYTAHV